MKKFLLFLIPTLILVIIRLPKADSEAEKRVTVSPKELAQQGLQSFIKRHNAPLKDDSQFTIRVTIPNDIGTGEYWLEALEFTDSLMSGIAKEEPRKYYGITIGKRYNFSSEDVVDWAFDSSGVKIGLFQTRELLKRMPAKDATYIKEILGWE